MKTVVVGLTRQQRFELERILKLVPPIVDQSPEVGQLISFDVCAVGTLTRIWDKDGEREKVVLCC